MRIRCANTVERMEVHRATHDGGHDFAADSVRPSPNYFGDVLQASAQHRQVVCRVRPLLEYRAETSNTMLLVPPSQHELSLSNFVDKQTDLTETPRYVIISRTSPHQALMRRNNQKTELHTGAWRGRSLRTVEPGGSVWPWSILVG